MAIDGKHPAPGTIIAVPTPADPNARWDHSSHKLPWEKFNHCDVWLYPGTPIIANDGGTISPMGRTLGRGPAGGPLVGLHAYLVSHTSPFVYYYGGLRAISVHREQVVNKGDVIGYSGVLGGTPHLHFSLQRGFNPQEFVRGAYRLGAPKGGRKPKPPGASSGGGAGVPPLGWGPDSTSGDNSSLPDVIESAWHDFEFALRVTLPTSANAIRQASVDVHKAVY